MGLGCYHDNREEGCVVFGNSVSVAGKAWDIL